MFNDYPDVLNVAQLSKALNIGKNSAYALCNNHVIGCKRIGRKILVPKICLIDYVQSSRYSVSKT